MKIIVDIPDNEAKFGIEVLKSLSFVKKAMPMSVAGFALHENLTEAAEEVRLHKEGKIVLQSAKDFLHKV